MNSLKGALCALAIVPGLALANQNSATLTGVDGDVKIFTHPSKKAEGPAPRALFEGEYYSVESAKVGVPVENGNIIRTAPGSKVKVVYENGDQFNVGPATAYRIFWDQKDEAKGKTEIAMMYGKIRGVVSKEGPRSRLFIKTKTATMGVRGTDFFIADDGGVGTEVSVLRGKVEVEKKATEGKKAEKVELAQGNSVEVSTEKDVKPVEVRKTTQEELTAISKSTTTTTKTTEELKKEVGETEFKKLETLEKKAVEATLKDIKTYNPKLYAELDTKKMANSNELNQSVVTTLTKEAPAAPKKRKPYRAELEDLGADAYKKYFKE